METKWGFAWSILHAHLLERLDYTKAKHSKWSPNEQRKNPSPLINSKPSTGPAARETKQNWTPKTIHKQGRLLFPSLHAQQCGEGGRLRPGHPNVKDLATLDQLAWQIAYHEIDGSDAEYGETDSLEWADHLLLDDNKELPDYRPKETKR